MPRRHSEETRQSALVLLRDQTSVTAISKLTGVSRNTLYRWAAEEGIALTLRKTSRVGECRVDGCQRSITASSLCNMHYQRLSTTGMLELVQVTLMERLVRRIHEDLLTGCWIWFGSFIWDTGAKHPVLYGSVWDGKTRPVHRVVYELFHGEIPEGYQVDHLCSVPLCVNPSHLEAVTPRENVRRTWERGRGYSQRRDNQAG
jgi:hypothetical protein